MRKWLVIGMAGLLAACAGDSTAPIIRAPLAGTYRVTATFAGVPTTMASTTGIITIAPATGVDSTLVATADLFVTLQGASMELTEISNLQVAPSGTVSFDVNTLNPDATWSWTGQWSSSSTIAGSNSLVSPGVQSSPGSFTMVRVGAQ